MRNRELYRVTFSPDEGGGATAPEQGAGDQGGAGGEGEQQAPGWVAALPDELKGNEWIKGFQKPGDFAKAALDLKTQNESFETKMKGAIVKPGENASPEEVAAYRAAMDIPETPDKYEFPKTEGIEQDEKMMDWARKTFHAAGISKDAAAAIVKEWDGFAQAMNQQHEQIVKEAAEQGVKAAAEALRTKWGTEYDKNLEMTKRGYEAFEKIVPGFKELLETVKVAGDVTLGNDPRMAEMFRAIAHHIGDDLSILGNNTTKGNPSPEDAGKNAFQTIYKVPNPPRDK